MPHVDHSHQAVTLRAMRHGTFLGLDFKRFPSALEMQSPRTNERVRESLAVYIN